MEITSGAGQPGVSAEELARAMAEQQAKAAQEAARTSAESAQAAPKEVFERAQTLDAFEGPSPAAQQLPLDAQVEPGLMEEASQRRLAESMRSLGSPLGLQQSSGGTDGSTPASAAEPGRSRMEDVGASLRRTLLDPQLILADASGKGAAAPAGRATAKEQAIIDHMLPQDVNGQLKTLLANPDFQSADAKAREAMLENCQNCPALAQDYNKLVSTDSFKKPVDNGNEVPANAKGDAQARLAQVVGDIGSRAHEAKDPAQQRILQNTLDNVTTGKVKVETCDNNFFEATGKVKPGEGGKVGGLALTDTPPPRLLLNREGLEIKPDGLGKKSETSGLLVHEMNHLTRAHLKDKARLDQGYRSQHFRDEWTAYCAEYRALNGRMPTIGEAKKLFETFKAPPYDMNESAKDWPGINAEQERILSNLKEGDEAKYGLGAPGVRLADHKPDSGSWSLNNEIPSDQTKRSEMDAQGALIKKTAEEEAAAKDEFSKKVDAVEHEYANITADDDVYKMVKEHPEYLKYATPDQRKKMMNILAAGYTSDKDLDAMKEIMKYASGAELAEYQKIYRENR